LEYHASSVESIISALSNLENDIENLSHSVHEMKKRIMAYSNQEIENLKSEVIAIANQEAKKIIDIAKFEAEKESSTVVREAEETLVNIKKNIDSSFTMAVDNAVRMILGQTISSTSNM
jgi:vacuolar-type H+-ATPase subunit H